MKHKTKRWPRWVETKALYTHHNETAKRRIKHIQCSASMNTGRTSYKLDSHHISRPATDGYCPPNEFRRNTNSAMEDSWLGAAMGVVDSDPSLVPGAFKNSSRQSELRSQNSRVDKDQKKRE